MTTKDTDQPGLDLWPASPWIKHTRSHYISMIGLMIIEIDRTGKRWTATLTTMNTGEIRYMDSTSALSVFTQAVEKAAIEYSLLYDKKKGK